MSAPRSLRRTVPVAAIALGAAAVLGTGSAVAAVKGFDVGHTTKEKTTSTLSNSGKHEALSLKTKSSKTAPLKVSNSTEIPKLNSALVGGFTGKSLAPLVLRSGGTFKIPVGVKDFTVQAYGAGGSGGAIDSANSAPGAGGAAGGGITAIVKATAGQTYVAVVGAASPAATADHGGATGGFSSVTLVGAAEAVAYAPGGGGGVDGEDCGVGLLNEIIPSGRAGDPSVSTGLQAYGGSRAGRPGTCTSSTPGSQGAGLGIVGAGGAGGGDGVASQAGQPGLVIVEFAT